MTAERTEINSFDLEIVRLTALEQIAKSLRQRSLAAVACCTVNCNEDVRVGSAAAFVAGDNRYVVLHVGKTW